ncbi:MAG: DoxX family protein [Candidatus Krumholzibacteriia bacterium]
MNFVLWIIQGLLALHTAVGAVWKFSNSEQAVPTLSAIPHGAWLAMAAVEIACALGLVAPLLYRPAAVLAPVAALVIALEMLIFTGLHLMSGASDHSPILYWLVVAAVCAFVAYGRLMLSPVE